MTQSELAQWMVNYLAERLDVPVDLIDTELSFDRYGLDSVMAACFVADLAEHIGADLDPSIVYDHQSIDALSTHLRDTAQYTSQDVGVVEAL